MRMGSSTVWICLLLFAATCASAGQSGGRILTRSDVVAVRIVDHPELDTTTRVEPDGTINFPYVGRIQAAGRSEDDLGRDIGRRLVELKILAGQ
jgi:polysaccharide biosynthesis/export protein